MTQTPKNRLGVRAIQALKFNHEGIVALTAYDACFAGLAEAAGVDMILVGDSLGMTVLGHDTTIPVTLEQSLHHTAAVVRGCSRPMVVGDMPFLTYHINADEALRNAGRYLQEAGASGVKLEGGRGMCPTIKRLTTSGIPVLGHIGILPQSVLATGGYRVQGRSSEEAQGLKADALALQEAGAFAIVLEGLPRQLAETISGELEIPTIGIGAGPGCDGQIQVVHDILGLFTAFKPKHARRYANLAEQARDAMEKYCRDVRSGDFPGAEETFE
jgi:3-methyl-2-oxobutanoate hydroxymethyltransferase